VSLSQHIRTERVSLETLRDLLALVSRRASLNALRSWTPNQRAAAEKWAAATHLRASDNVVRVPPMPACVKCLKEIR